MPMGERVWGAKLFTYCLFFEYSKNLKLYNNYVCTNNNTQIYIFSQNVIATLKCIIIFIIISEYQPS